METQKNNSVRLTGFIGQDPEIREIGKAQLIRFSVATNHSYKNTKGEWIKDTHWHNLILWNKASNNTVAELKKGILVSIEGRLESRNYTDKKGIKHYITEVVVNELSFPQKEQKTGVLVA